MPGGGVVYDKVAQFPLGRWQWNILQMSCPFVYYLTSLRSQYCYYHSHFADRQLEAWTGLPPRGHTGVKDTWALNLGRTGSNRSCYYCAICLSNKMSLYLLLLYSNCLSPQPIFPCGRVAIVKFFGIFIFRCNRRKVKVCLKSQWFFILVFLEVCSEVAGPSYS